MPRFAIDINTADQIAKAYAARGLTAAEVATEVARHYGTGLTLQRILTAFRRAA
jgi:hypothetical protein